ncbi:MAG: LacI family DNA-binding transcriptional regulator [Sphaerochaetaceae bacterium]
MEVKVTLADIAKKANVSIAAVSMILTNKNLTRFSKETIETVYTTARSLGYKQKHLGDKDGLIIIVCPSVINPYFATLLQGMELEANQNNYKTIVFNTYWNLERERDVLRIALNPLIKGVIFSMMPQQPELVSKVAKRLPVVAVGDKQDEVDLDTVEVNNYDAGYLLGKHLIELGHKKVCYVSTSLNNQHSSRVLRLKGLQDSYKQLCPEGEVALLCSEVNPETELSTVEIEHQVGMQLAKTCLETHKEITAIVAINDMVAYGVMDQILQQGYQIPRDYSICGFDNIYPSQFQGVSLTTIDHFINQRGQSAFSLMQAKLEHKNEDNHSITRVEFRNQLVIRKTTSVPRPDIC